MAAIDITPKQDKGVLKEILKEGVGDELPGNGCKVSVHYTGTLIDGTKFDSSKDRGDPFEFNLGKGNVIKAWDLGVATMKRGESCKLTCASEYAYGASGSPPTIPPNATLIFEIDMIDWKGEDLSSKKDEGVIRYAISPGKGLDYPNDGATVDVHLIGKYQGRQFEDRHVSFELGEGSEKGVVDGVEKSLEKFKLNETSRLIIKPKYAFKSTGNKEFDIPPNAEVEYIVTLKNFERAKDSWAMDSSERIEQGQIFKDKGTKYFKDSKFGMAIKMYKKVIGFVASVVDSEGDLEEKRKSVLLSAHLNLALCYLKTNVPFSAIEHSTQALTIDANNEKALFRRGQAQLAVGEPEKALNDFTTVVKIQPDNKAAANQIIIANKMVQEQKSKEKQIYANMFDKFAKRDTEKEEEERRKLPDVMKTLGEWGEDERERAPTEFEKENPNILMLDGSGQFTNM